MPQKTTDDFLRRQLIPLAYRQLSARELFARAAAGDAEAYIAFVCLKYPLVASACHSIPGLTGLAEDVIQEVFVELWRQREKIRDVEAIDGWLTRTAQNIARKSVAREAKGRE